MFFKARQVIKILPRRSIGLAIQYGKELAASVERVLSEDMHMQESVLTTRYAEIDLPFENHFLYLN